ncbi:hypothetical protein FOZ61_000099 [Perkinsus olseni]|uniref:Uncharacterized protein n=1 Tax=Perkinsus olseni TaxID=32597 RepID=A0A7J6MFY6_PEROL|nr:hypothetical protein FOZ61_000099 [Perkinsus olseni]
MASAAVSAKIMGPARKEAARPARALRNALAPPDTELGKRLASIELSRPQSHLHVLRSIELSGRGLSVDEAIYALRILAASSPGGQKVRRISKDIKDHPAYENLHESIVKQATIMKPYEVALVYNRAVFLRLFPLVEEEVISDVLDQSIARLQPDSLAAVLKALAEVRQIPEERLRAVEQRLLAVIRREEEYRDRRVKGKGEPMAMPPPSLGIQVALHSLQKLAAIHASRVGSESLGGESTALKGESVTRQLIGELVRRVRTMAATGDLDPHDISAAYVSLEKALGRNNAATRELESILVTRGLSDLSQMELGRLADVVHPGTPLQRAVVDEFGERPKLSTEVVVRALKLLKRVQPSVELPRRPVANIINTVRFFFASPENQKACRITVTNLMQFIANIDPMLGSARVVGTLLNAAITNVDRIQPSHLLRLLSHLHEIKLTEVHPFYQDRIDRLIDNLIGRGPAALQYPLLQLFALKLLALLERYEPIYVKGLAEVVVSDALKRGASGEAIPDAAVNEDEEDHEESSTILVRVPKHYENYDNFVLAFAYHLKMDHNDAIKSDSLDTLVEEITTSPERLRRLTMAALVCADKLGVGDREIMQEALATTLQDTPTKALINIAVKPTAATKLAGTEEEQEAGAFSRELLLDHAIGILNERAATLDDPMMAVDVLDLWSQYPDRIPDDDVLHSVVSLAMSPQAMSVRYMKMIQCVADIGITRIDSSAHGRKQIAATLYAWLLKSNKQFKKVHFGVLAHTLASTAKIHRDLEGGLQLDAWAHTAALLDTEVANGALEEADNAPHLYRVKDWWQCVQSDVGETTRVLIRLAHPKMADLLDNLAAEDVPRA